jgi:hypothetical protein
MRALAHVCGRCAAELRASLPRGAPSPLIASPARSELNRSDAGHSDDDGGSDASSTPEATSGHAAAQTAEIRALNLVWRNVLAAHEATLQETRRAADAERARAERAAMRGEEERATLVAVTRAQQASLQRWRGVATRALLRVALAEAARQEALQRATREAQERAAAEAVLEEEQRAAAALRDAEARRVEALLLMECGETHWWWGPQR